ncbi:YheC/YheD family endospore coat-associated protein [Bacillus andreraoultii]|uniref:YheC/YheD family endospore coat-associated protein n=1 Tax=Bacillus andreraoultii TaxID=1499685 RepID=UPI0005399EB5|nr:YheC/YheD family protein [Bacillus andreraoultii]
MINSYPLEINEENEKVLYYPKELNFSRIHTVTFGSLSIPCKTRAQKTKKKKITLSRALANAFHIPNIPLKFHLFEKEGTLFIGPIVGIFTAGFTSYPDNPIGNRSYSLSRLFANYEQLGVLPIVFGIQHINWEHGIVSGFIYTNNHWKQIDLPLPNVIYDRLPNRTVENLAQIKKLKRKLQDEYAIPWFNPRFFNKMEVYQKLVKESSIKTYLPKTVQFSDDTLLKEMLDEFGYIYLKPDKGSAGAGIFQIKQTDEGIFVRFRDEDSQNRLIKFTHNTTLYRFLQEKISEPYIIQQGIQLIRFNQQFADFRIHTNKNPEGKWVATVLACKLSGKGSPTTHVMAGGEVKTLDEIFINDEERKDYTKKLVRAVILLSEQLEKKMDGIIAEIGFDIGIDEDGKIWMFEANAKPGRSIFKHPHLLKYEKLINKYVMLFAVELTNAVIQTPEKMFTDLIMQ